MSDYIKNLDNLIKRWSNEEAVPYEVIWGIVWHESVLATDGQDIEKAQWAVRPEPGFYGTYLRNRPYATLAGFRPKLIPTSTGEKLLRSASFGHMQIMGETARVLGCKVQFLTELCTPEENIKWGTKAYAKHYHHRKTAGFAANVKRSWALQRYNGGGDPYYSSKVEKHARTQPWAEKIQKESFYA